MAGFVADSSVGIAWSVFAQASEATTTLRAEVMEGRLPVVPTLWAFEVANTLVMLKRRRKLDDELYAEAVHWVSRVKTYIDDFDKVLVFGRISELAAEHSLTVYDATYLELAL